MRACETSITLQHTFTDCRLYEESRHSYNIPPNLLKSLGPNTTFLETLFQFLKNHIIVQIFFKKKFKFNNKLP